MKSQLMISDGRSQSQRQLPALSGDYFHLNEMRFEQLLAIASEYARLMHFYQPDLSTDGDWYQFFAADETVLIATILAVDTQFLSKQFEHRLQSEPDYSDWFRTDIATKLDASYRDLINSPLLVLRLLNQWLTAFSLLPNNLTSQAKTLLEGILRGLKWEIQSLINSTPAELKVYVNALFSKQFKELVEWPANSVTVNSPVEKLTVSTTQIRHNFHTLNLAINMLQNGVKKLLPTSITSGNHDPAISLLISFIRLFEKLKKRLNRFSDKHIDFYYGQVLGMEPQRQRPDSAHIVVKTNTAVRQSFIENGAEFIAGNDTAQRDIVYKADSSAQLSDAKIAAIHTLFFDRHASASQLLTTQSAYLRTIEPPPPDGEQSLHESLPPLPLMGAPKPGEHVSGGSAARFGFAIASHTLLMHEGERTVCLTFQFRNNSKYTLESSLKEIANQILKQEKHTQHGQTSRLRNVDVFVKLVRSMFRLSLTSATGWHQITEYRPEYQGLNAELRANCLTITFTLPASAPAITEYQESIHGAGFQTALPVLRGEMTQNEYAYPYDILNQWFLDEIHIDVHVNGCRQLVLHNHIGQVSTLAPFLPFGPLPDIGSYLVLGCEEILSKQLRDLSVDVEWAGLPSSPGGFVSYYSAYDSPLQSGGVQIKMSVLVDGKWVSASANDNLFQHQTNDDGTHSNQVRTENRLSFRSVIPFYKQSLPTLQATASTAFSYTSATMNGMFKISLIAPDGAFGHQEYPHLLSQTLTSNAQTKKINLRKALPNPPYTPQISRIVLNYEACSKISFEHNKSEIHSFFSEQFIHLHPIGYEAIQIHDNKDVALIPDYDATGNLLIGLTAQRLSGPLSLYFYLREDSLPMTKIADANLTWSYLSSNRWKKLQQAQILDDSTQGFMTSGIVQLQLPDDIDSDHTVMPNDMFWLKVTAQRGLERFCSLYGIYTQAIKVTWDADQGQKLTSVLPAFSINKSRKNIAGIDQILQIRCSFDGKSEESVSQFRTRASERLRHKNRSLTASDYESLILEKFPQVYKVKCFSNLCTDHGSRRQIRPGHILIVPIPHLNQGGHSNQKPNLSGHLIHEIQSFIKTYAPADATISVENPVYEEIQVRCTIKLKTEFNNSRFGGRYIEQINQAICDYLSPWNVHGQHRHFGWSIQQHNVVSFLHDLEYVDEVSGVSMLQICPVGSSAELLYALKDNAKFSHQEKDLQPSYPWSIAVPINDHWIVIADKPGQHSAKAIGVNELKVGSTFIIPARTET